MIDLTLTPSDSDEESDSDIEILSPTKAAAVPSRRTKTTLPAPNKSAASVSPAAISAKPVKRICIEDSGTETEDEELPPVAGPSRSIQPHVEMSADERFAMQLQAEEDQLAAAAQASKKQPGENASAHSNDPLVALTSHVKLLKSKGTCQACKKDDGQSGRCHGLAFHH